MKEITNDGAGADQKSASAPTARRKYIGPEYNFGLVITALRDRLVRPLDLSDADIAALIKEYPPAAEWWA